jgi:glycogen debranching enzyme
VKDFVGPSFDTNIVPNGHDTLNNIIGIDETSLRRVYTQALADLQMLRVKHSSGHDILAAGLPWFMALFGRDSIISAIQTRSLDPTLMVNTLQVLAGFQAKDIDAFHEAQPGKILHEVRMGELSVLNEMPHSCYYGSVDATPLFLRLLWEAYEASHDLQLVQQMLPIAENALEWIDKYGDMDGDGFVEYDPAPSNRHGLKNQGWKDSNDSISYMDGRLAEGPIALVEVQGYVYDAKRRMAELYRILGNSQRALKLTQEAEKLRNHFEEAYWMPDYNFYAVALDGNKRQVDTITSNPGHCLWSNIVSPNRVSMVVERLMAPDMFSGWGVRTLSTEMVRYNPLAYHNGSIWPHDNSIIAVGMKSYGFNIEAKKIAMGIFDAALSFPKYRPPELFAGYPRRENSVPIAYPAANAPQAWASGAIIYLTDNVLGMRN